MSFGYDPSKMNPKLGQLNQAKRIARIAGCPVEEVYKNWRDGFRWCSKHGFVKKIPIGNTCLRCSSECYRMSQR